MKRFFQTTFFSLLFSLLCAASFAKPATIDSVCKSLSSKNVTTGNFVQEKIINQRTLKSNGTFILSKSGINFTTEKPIKSSQSITPTSIITITSDGKHITVDTSEDALFQSITQVITSIFDGNKTKLEKDFQVSISASEKEWNVKLLPNDKNMASVVKEINLGGTGNFDASELCYMTLVLNNGATIKYTFSDHKYKNALSESEKLLFK